MADNDLIYALNEFITTPGSLGIGSIKDEGRIRFIVSNAGPANLIRVQARITGQMTWSILGDLQGNANKSIEVFGYDEMEIVCLVFDPLSNFVQLVASGFDGSSISLEVPGGTVLDSISTIKYISSDSSVSITANESTGEIDFMATGAGGAAAPFIQSFTSINWVPDAGNYKLSVPAATHSKGLNPLFQIYEDVSGDFEEIETQKELNPSGDITILVPQTPDLRFAGKIIIK